MSPSSSLPQFKFVGFTGHRELTDNGLARKGVEAALARVQASGAKAEWIAVSSAAEGADALFAEIALAAGLAWQVVLPLPPHQFREDFSAEAWPRIEALLKRAEASVVVPPTESRTEAYLDAGLETVDRADVLIAVWDGQQSRGQGGTAEIVTYARERGRPLLIVDARTGACREENMTALALADPLIDDIDALPPPEAVVSAEAGATDRPESLVEFWQKADLAATAGAPHFRRMVGGTVILHVLATLVAVTAVVFHWHWTGLPWVKLGCLVGALSVAVVLTRSHAHHRWLRQRIAAEVCRSALGAWGLRGGFPFLDGIRVPELRGLVRTLQQLHRRGRATAGPKSLAAFKEGYLISRIERQSSYYHRQELKAAPFARRLRFSFWAATYAAIACTGFYAIAATLHLGVGAGVESVFFYLLPIGLPVVAAGCLSFISINDLQRRVASYREMQAMLERSRRQLAATHSWNAVAKVVAATEEGLLHEVLEWHAIARHSESH